LTIINQPKPNTSPLVGENRFHLLPKLYNDHFAWSNGPEFLSFVPYISSPDSGNWLLGLEAGVDNGYVFHETSATLISPEDIPSHSLEEGKSWKWLLSNNWQAQPAMRIICMNHEEDSQMTRQLYPPNTTLHSYYEIEYFDEEEQLQSSYLFPLNSLSWKQYPKTKLSTIIEKKSSPKKLTSLLKKHHTISVEDDNDLIWDENYMSNEEELSRIYWMYDPKLEQFTKIKIQENLSEFGYLHTITYTLRQSSHRSNTNSIISDHESSSKILKNDDHFVEYGILVNIEHAVSSWRQTYHLIVPPSSATSSYSSSSSFLSRVGTSIDGHTTDFTTTVHNNNRNMMQRKKGYRMEEIIVELQSNTLLHTSKNYHPSNPNLDFQEDYQVQIIKLWKHFSKVSSHLLFQQNMEQIILQTKVSDYLWIWHKKQTGLATKYVVNDQENLQKIVIPYEQQNEESLVKCIQHYYLNSSQKSVWLFEIYPSHRSEFMHQTISESIFHRIVIVYNHRLSSFHEVNDLDEHLQAKDLLFGIPVQREQLTHEAFEDTPEIFATTSTLLPIHRSLDHWSAIVPLTANPLYFLAEHLVTKEKRLSSTLSSCFFYHAAVSFPQPLLYAGEILCNLLGAKPVVMIQMESPSDHQWKFPFVKELIQSIVSAKQIFGDSKLLSISSTTNQTHFPIEHILFPFRKDYTLLFYRANRMYLKNAILPSHIAQALHPMPFPEDEPDIHSPNRKRLYEEQIYNAAWNGLILGYPEYFVTSYCESFHHNGLSQEERLDQFQQAKRNYEKFIHSELKLRKRIQIEMGLDTPISSDQLQFIFDHAVGSNAVSQDFKDQTMNFIYQSLNLYKRR
jgi:hypothetical protein